MKLRTILDELATLSDRKTLRLGVLSGYTLSACFALLTGLAIEADVLRWHPAFAALIGAKLLANTLALLALRLDRGALAFGGLNTAMDAVVMTGAIWATGDTASPLVAIYVVEVTVLALLTNLTATVMVGLLCVMLYVLMGALTATGALPSFPTPAEWSGEDRWTHLVLASLFAAFVIAAPTFYTSGILLRLKANERRLQAKTVALVDAGKQKAQFMANVTHELRTPLQGIMGLSELVSKGIYGPATDRQRQAMRDMKGSAIRLLRLIDDLLQLAADDAGKLSHRTERVELGELLPGTLATVQWLLQGKQLAIELDVEPGLPALATDRGKLNQIVLNLVSNAVKFTPDGGSIIVRARRTGDALTVEVEDTGVGIAPRDLERIFDEFFQVDGSMSREYGGVGLGLALVRRLLALLGGSIDVRSELGQGSTFRVTLPLTGSLPAQPS